MHNKRIIFIVNVKFVWIYTYGETNRDFGCLLKPDEHLSF